MPMRDTIPDFDIDDVDAVRRPYDDEKDLVGLLVETQTVDADGVTHEWGKVVTRDDNEAHVFVTRTNRLETLESTQATMVRDVVRDVVIDDDSVDETEGAVADD